MKEPAYETVIGLEVHAQLLTRTKLFCADTTAFGAPPNSQVSTISLGHPGTLPRLNEAVIPLALRLGLACGCDIIPRNFFARKNYFYPDLPKGYQISQHTAPICRNGSVEITTPAGNRSVRLNRIHIEEDAGKSSHDPAADLSLIDYNRAGMPLLEIVTEPDLRSGEEAAAYVTTLRRLVRHLGVCDGNMEEGSLRCDVNISVRPEGDTALGTKVEIKNLNSIRFIKKAVEFEQARLIDLHRRGAPILQQTRGFDEASGTTYAIRTKEDEDDYRYFPDPDLPPFIVTPELIEAVRADMPPGPEAEKHRLMEAYGLNEADAALLSADPELTALFEAVAKHNSAYKTVANWMTGPVRALLQASEQPAAVYGLKPGALAALIGLVEDRTLGHGVASGKVLPALVADPDLDIPAYIQQQDLALSTSGDEVDGWIEAALARHEQKITEYRRGKKGLLSLFVGEVMRLSRGKADAARVTELIREKLK